MVKSRIESEKKIVQHMILIYCKGNKHSAPAPCETCKQLLEYAHKRLNHCRFGEEKTFCEQCPVHCYKPDMRVEIKKVMRYSGPRMLLHHPVIAVKHVFSKLKT